MDATIIVGLTGIGVVTIINLLIVSFRYGQLNEKVTAFCKDIRSIKDDSSVTKKELGSKIDNVKEELADKVDYAHFNQQVDGVKDRLGKVEKEVIVLSSSKKRNINKDKEK